VLASAHTIVTYDRRGNSRSPGPPEWTATTIDEQADDAAALLGALDVEQTVVMGTSAAAGIVANLALRHDSLLRGVVIHEPLFQSVVTNADAVRAGRRALIEAGLAKGGRRGATEAFCATRPVRRCMTRSIGRCANGCWETAKCSSASKWAHTSPTSRHATNSP
jgi:pimeloyl-ACP methyl ester carboxylesterase